MLILYRDREHRPFSDLLSLNPEIIGVPVLADGKSKYGTGTGTVLVLVEPRAP